MPFLFAFTSFLSTQVGDVCTPVFIYTKSLYAMLCFLGLDNRANENKIKC